MPVPISPVDGQRRALRVEFAFQRGDQSAVLFVDGALAAKVVVVFRNFQHALPRHIFPAQHILQERDDVFRTLRATKRDQQQGVIAFRKNRRESRRHRPPLDFTGTAQMPA